MARLTCNSIIKAACEETGLKSEYIELFKAKESDGGTYYWRGSASYLFTESNTHTQKLSDWPLERWIEDLKGKISDARPSDWQAESFTGLDMNKQIESE